MWLTIDSKAAIKSTFNPIAFILALLDVFVDWGQKAKQYFSINIFTGIVHTGPTF